MGITGSKRPTFLTSFLGENTTLQYFLPGRYRGEIETEKARIQPPWRRRGGESLESIKVEVSQKYMR